MIKHQTNLYQRTFGIHNCHDINENRRNRCQCEVAKKLAVEL